MAKECTAAYLRISSDPSDRRAGVKRQRQECEQLADRLGWAPLEVYEDNDKSAAGGKHRPAFDRMKADIASGSVTRVIAFDQDRIDRDAVGWLGFRELCLAHSVTVAFVTARGVVPLGGSSGLLDTGVSALTHQVYVENPRAKMTAFTAERAVQGKPQGRPTYGYRRVVDTDRLGYRVKGSSRDEIDETSAAIVREAATRMLKGDSLRGICADLEARGVDGPAGKRWTARTLRRIVTNPSVAGRRIHNGTVIGPTAAPAILDDATFDRVAALLADPSRRTVAPGNTARHLLSGIARCGVCSETVRARGTSYACPVGHTARKREWVDELALAHAVAFLTRPDARDLFTPDTPDVAPIEDEVAALRARLDLAADEYAAGTLDAESWRRVRSRVTPGLERATERLRAARRSAGTPEVLADLLDADDVTPALLGLPLARQRAVLDALLTLTILPVGKADGQRMRWHGFDPATVRVEPKVATS